MHDFAFIDETLDINLTQSYKLSIQVSLNGLSFCILDPVRNKYIALINKNIEFVEFDDFLNEIENILTNDDLLKKSYKSVKLIWVSEKNTLIPSAQFSENGIKSKFEFVQKLDDLDEIHYNKVNYIDAYCVFTIPSQLATTFLKHHNNIKFYNQQVPFIETAFFKHHSESKCIFININKTFIDIIIANKGKLELYNNFIYKNEMDVIYYILNIYNQFNIDTTIEEVYLSGFIDKKDDKVYSKLSEFIENIKFSKQADDFTFSYTFNKIPNHKFSNLFNLNHCE